MTTAHGHTVRVDIPTLETERLRLRAPKMADCDPYAVFSESDNSRFVGGPFPRHTVFTRLSAIAGHWNLRGYGRWIVADKTTDEAQGIVGPFHPEEWPEPEVAWTVFPNAQGQSIAFEAATAARAYVYQTLGWKTVVSCVAPDNARSEALAKRMGCTADGAFEHEEYGTLNIWRHPAPEALQ